MFPYIEIKKKRAAIYGPFTIFRAKRDGTPILRTEKTSLWDINGCMLQVRSYRITFIFKRSKLDRALRAINRR